MRIFSNDYFSSYASLTSLHLAIYIGGSLSPCARGSNGWIPLSHPLHYINPPSSSSNPNLFPLLEPPLLEHHIAHSSHFPHPNLLILWDLREQDPIYTSTKPICVPRKISSPLTCYSWSVGS